MLPLLIKSELFSFSCCNQISGCLENNIARDGSKVTCSEILPVRWNLIISIVFIIQNILAVHLLSKKFPAILFRAAFMLKERRCVEGGRKCTSLPYSPQDVGPLKPSWFPKPNYFIVHSPPQQHALPRDMVCLNTTHLMESLKLSQFHRF